MSENLCVLWLLCLVAALANSESVIEVDENGEEYEVKRFNVLGRQLNGGRSQCVESRRKRATSAQPQHEYSDPGLNLEFHEKDAIGDGKQQAMIFYVPPVGTYTTDDVSDEEKQNDKNTNEVFEEKEAEPTNANKTEDKEEMEDIKTNKGEAFDADAIEGLKSHAPVKVDPQTHAVFELIPINYASRKEVEQGAAPDYFDSPAEAGDVQIDFDFNEDLTPVTTTAIWSTGVDNPSDFYNEGQALTAESVKPTKSHKKNRKTNLQKRQRNKKLNKGYRRGLAKGKKKRRNSERRPNRANVRRPVKRRKVNRGSNTRRPSPYESMIKVPNSKPMRRKNYQNNRHRRMGSKGVAYLGDTEESGVNVNCIIIRKDSLPTTRRPFWNVFGRSAKDKRRPSGHFGNRKRTNVRFVV